MQNGPNESFWDGLGVEIGPCAIFPKNGHFIKNDPGVKKRHFGSSGYGVGISKVPTLLFCGGAWGGVPHRKVPKKVPEGGTRKGSQRVPGETFQT